MATAWEATRVLCWRPISSDCEIKKITSDKQFFTLTSLRESVSIKDAIMYTCEEAIMYTCEEAIMYTWLSVLKKQSCTLVKKQSCTLVKKQSCTLGCQY